jgi:CRP-like cAMP-binding protein
MATVTTVTPVRMLAIDRDEFLADATGGAAARDAADELVETRLAIAESPAGTTWS